MEQNLEQKTETKPNKKKTLLIVGIVVGFVVVATAAFLGGRLLNGSGGALSFLPFGAGGMASGFSISMEPAPELPITEPDVMGTMMERKDNTIYVQEFSLDAGGGGVVISSSGDEGTSITTSSGLTGPKVEVVITNETLIYVDVTEFDFQGEETTTIQQVVETGSLDDLTSQTMVTVWGRKVGDRVIADVLLYSNPILFTAP